jgi:hypothetical protein
VGHRLSRRFSGSPRGHKPFSTSRSENGPKSKNNGSSSSLCWTSKTEHQSSQKAASVCSSRLGLRGADIRPGPGFRALNPTTRISLICPSWDEWRGCTRVLGGSRPLRRLSLANPRTSIMRPNDE